MISMTMVGTYDENEYPATDNDHRRSRSANEYPATDNEHRRSRSADEYPATNNEHRWSSCAVLIILLVSFIVITIIMPLLIVLFCADPILRVTIDSYEGMPKNESNTTTFTPEFNITMYGRQALFDRTFCYNNGTINILHQGFRIATGPIVESCLRASNGRTVMLFAWGRNVDLPLYLVNWLRDEIQRGVAVLEAEIYFDNNGLFTCWPVIESKEYSPCS